MDRLTGQILIEDMTPAEIARAEKVESVLGPLREVAAEVDARGEFYVPHVKTLSDAGLLGLIVPEAYGGMGAGCVTSAPPPLRWPRHVRQQH